MYVAGTGTRVLESGLVVNKLDSYRVWIQVSVDTIRKGWRPRYLLLKRHYQSPGDSQHVV